MSSADSWETIRQYVDRQRTYLRNPLPPSPWICGTCRGTCAEGFTLCRRCSDHHDGGGQMLADAVIPISYSPRTGQHHHHLRMYKAFPPSAQAQRNLLALLLQFLRDHLDCVAVVAGGHPTHIATVPSTRGRPGPHPLSTLIGRRLGLPWVPATTNPRYGPDDRDFHRDWFTAHLPGQPAPTRVLIPDDTPAGRGFLRPAGPQTAP